MYMHCSTLLRISPIADGGLADGKLNFKFVKIKSLDHVDSYYHFSHTSREKWHPLFPGKRGKGDAVMFCPFFPPT